jgi:DNA-directed RNA polymerase specialized sigma24 family protein
VKRFRGQGRDLSRQEYDREGSETPNRASYKDDRFLERFETAVKSMPPTEALLLLRVSIFKWSPEEAAQGLGLPTTRAGLRLLLARAVLRNLLLERGEPRS